MKGFKRYTFHLAETDAEKIQDFADNKSLNLSAMLRLMIREYALQNKTKLGGEEE